MQSRVRFAEFFRLAAIKYFILRRSVWRMLLITSFWDEADGGFFFTANDHEELIVRTKDYFDNATGELAAADLLLKIAAISGDETLRALRRHRASIGFVAQIKRYPPGFRPRVVGTRISLRAGRDRARWRIEEVRSGCLERISADEGRHQVGGDASSETIPCSMGNR